MCETFCDETNIFLRNTANALRCQVAQELEAKNAALITLVGDMGGRHEQLTDAIRYFEDQYVQDPSKDKVELLTKE